jgi:uncharacterized protein (TIGR02594 family)
MKQYEVTADELNVRSGPGTNYPRLGTVLNSAELDSPEMEGWVPVVYNGKIGWCSGKYLEEMQEAPRPELLDEPPWITWARRELGEKEVPGAGDNPDIVAWFELLNNFPKEYWHDATAWCAVFVNAGFCLNGVKGLGSARAVDWLKFGKAAKEPQVGDVVVFRWDDGDHHVAYFLAMEGDQVRVIGGNQHNAVTETTYPRENIMGFRRPPTA